MYVTVNKYLVSFQTYLGVLSRLCQREAYKKRFLITNIAVDNMLPAGYGLSGPDIKTFRVTKNLTAPACCTCKGSTLMMPNLREEE